MRRNPVGWCWKCLDCFETVDPKSPASEPSVPEMLSLIGGKELENTFQNKKTQEKNVSNKHLVTHNFVGKILFGRNDHTNMFVSKLMVA